MKYIIVEEQQFQIIENYKNAFDLEDFQNKLTEYFEPFDYIVGDYAYNKLRLKGFCKKENPKLNEINDYENKDRYIKDFCAYEARYFVLEKIK